MYLMASPPARGLFAKAIAESAYMISTPELKQRSFGTPSAEDSGVKLAAALHAPDIAALRAMDAPQLTNAAPAAGFAPWGTVDGHVICRASWSTSSTRANRRPCRCWPASTAAKSAR